MNTKQNHLLFLDISTQTAEVGRIFIEPLPSFPDSQAFAQLFVDISKAFLDRDRSVACTIGTLTEVKRNSHLKFTWNANADGILGQVRPCGFGSPVNSDPSSFPMADITATTSDAPNGLVVVPKDDLNSFYIVTSSWSAQDIPGKIVASVYKGMGLVQYMSWLNTNSEMKPTEKCVIANIGLIAPKQDLGLKQRDSILDPYPDLPTDSGIDYHNFEHVLTAACKVKASGNLLFRQENYQTARFRFCKAVRYISWASERQKLTRDQEVRALQIIVPCILNSAACRLKLKDFEGALEDCNEAMELYPNNPKAYFRRGQAHHGKMNYEQSLYDLRMALQLSPNDRSIKNEIAAVEGEMQVYRKVDSRRNSSETAMQS